MECSALFPTAKTLAGTKSPFKLQLRTYVFAANIVSYQLAQQDKHKKDSAVFFSSRFGDLLSSHIAGVYEVSFLFTE